MTPHDIYFAAGCFWGAEKFFKQVRGVLSTEVGFANGNTENPTYKQVYTDTTGYAECVHVQYDPQTVSLQLLTSLFFEAVDPLSLNRQGEDVGTRYRTGVYYPAGDSGALPVLREEFDRQQRKYDSPMVVELLPLRNFFRAEDYHQDYLDKNPQGYCHLNPKLFELARKSNLK